MWQPPLLSCVGSNPCFAFAPEGRATGGSDHVGQTLATSPCSLELLAYDSGGCYAFRCVQCGAHTLHGGWTAGCACSHDEAGPGRLFRRAYAPLVEAGYVEVVYGGAKEGQFLCTHPLVKSIHLTGSAATYDAVVWGSNKQKANSSTIALLQGCFSKCLNSLHEGVAGAARHLTPKCDWQCACKNVSKQDDVPHCIGRHFMTRQCNLCERIRRGSKASRRSARVPSVGDLPGAAHVQVRPH